MKQAEAKPRIIAAFDDWVKAGGRRNPTGFDGFSFFGDIKRDRPALLEFRTPNPDKWQAIHGWLIQAKRVSS